jgi:predicted nucleotidyltransferase
VTSDPIANAVRRIREGQRQLNKRLRDVARRAADQLANRPEVLRVILFGSVATETADALSDIDLAVIAALPESLSPAERSRRVLSWITMDRDVDIITYTPDEFVRLATESEAVRHEIVEKGVVLFERP